MFEGNPDVAPKGTVSRLPRSRPPYVRSSRLLMIIAADMEARMDLYKALEPLRCPMETCSTGIEGLKAATLKKPALLIMEWRLLDLSGPTLLDAFLQVHPGTAAILLEDGHDRIDEKMGGLRVAWEKVRMPVESEKLLSSAHRLLNKIS